MEERKSQQKGLLIMIAAALLLPVIDAISKVLTAYVSPGEIALVRFSLQGALLFPFAYRELKIPKLPLLATHFLRGILNAVASLCFIAAITQMPLADAIAIFFAEPLLLTLFSAVLLKEKIGIARITACLIGFAGALFIIGPSFTNFGATAILPFLTATFFALYLIVTRKQSKRGESVNAMQFYASMGATLFLLPITLLGDAFSLPLFELSWPTTEVALLFLGVGASSLISHQLLTIAFTKADANVLAPFQYLEIVSATILGWLLFGQFPGAQTLLGAGIIIASGMFIFYRESSYPLNKKGRS
ncbi:DMT family transporter [Desulfotalea psychrophila]|uniref:Conserved hypothetical membrane protein n=1 Tax=Desulfotalea psychrophila (strain LSv54 / DSM 12343) TaxID=177439 RepID=Q6ANK7_DESPS|nr:DMT family transporter [Desulfotalea psychrophila]CAG36067.1 conserved hypothetical membrane protein [Desulfotalea psychrophila LSv54]